MRSPVIGIVRSPLCDSMFWVVWYEVWLTFIGTDSAQPAAPFSSCVWFVSITIPQTNSDRFGSDSGVSAVGSSGV